MPKQLCPMQVKLMKYLPPKASFRYIGEKQLLLPILSTSHLVLFGSNDPWPRLHPYKVIELSNEVVRQDRRVPLSTSNTAIFYNELKVGRPPTTKLIAQGLSLTSPYISYHIFQILTMHIRSESKSVIDFLLV